MFHLRRREGVNEPTADHFSIKSDMWSAVFDWAHRKGQHPMPVNENRTAARRSRASEVKTLRYVGYAFSALAFLIFVYSFLFASESVLKEQAIYYFLVSLAAAVIPHIDRFKFKDFEMQMKDELQAVRDRVQELDHKVTQLFLITMSPDMYHNLEKLADGSFGDYKMSTGLERELYHLRDIGYIQVPRIKAIPKEGSELAQHVRITDTGKEFVRLRQAMEREKSSAS